MYCGHKNCVACGWGKKHKPHKHNVMCLIFVLVQKKKENGLRLVSDGNWVGAVGLDKWVVFQVPHANRATGNGCCIAGVVTAAAFGVFTDPQHRLETPTAVTFAHASRCIVPMDGAAVAIVLVVAQNVSKHAWMFNP